MSDEEEQQEESDEPFFECSICKNEEYENVYYTTCAACYEPLMKHMETLNEAVRNCNSAVIECTSREQELETALKNMLSADVNDLVAVAEARVDARRILAKKVG